MKNHKIFANLVKHSTKYRLEEFRSYTSEIESKFESDKIALAARYDKSAEDLSEEDIRAIDDYFSDDYYMIDEIYTGQYRKSTLVSIYSFLEHSMNGLCRHLSARHSYPVKIEDLKGDGIIRAKLYLEKLASVDFQPLNGEWSELQTLNKIRNCIVHSEGDIKASSKADLDKLIANTKFLNLRNERYIVIDRPYIDGCITTIENFLGELYQQVFQK